MEDARMVFAVIVAGGSGHRMGQDIPKQFIHINNKPVLIYTLEGFQNHPEIDKIGVVCVEGWESMLQAYARQFDISKLDWVITTTQVPSSFSHGSGSAHARARSSRYSG